MAKKLTNWLDCHPRTERVVTFLVLWTGMTILSISLRFLNIPGAKP